MRNQFLVAKHPKLLTFWIYDRYRSQWVHESRTRDRARYLVREYNIESRRKSIKSVDTIGLRMGREVKREFQLIKSA